MLGREIGTTEVTNQTGMNANVEAMPGARGILASHRWLLQGISMEHS